MSTESFAQDPPPQDAAPPSRLTVLGPTLLLVIAILLTGVLGVRILAKHRPRPPQDYGVLPAFHLTDQAGRPFTEADLAGKAWVVDFFFSRCTGVCPRLAERMRSVSKWLESDPRYSGRAGLLSITVDPENDTPPRLAEYARAQHVDDTRWKLVTGSSKAIEDVVAKGFHVSMGTPEVDSTTGRMDILHGSHLVLVDTRGHVRGYYQASGAGVEQLERDLARILDEKPEVTR